MLVGYLMFTLLRDIPVSDVDEGLPALLTMILMPLTYNITVGIGAGFITWVLDPGRARPRVRGAPADVGRVDRVRRVLPAGLDRLRHLADRRAGPAPSITLPAMFERTALAEGPRVISARMPGARSVSIAAYVLAGSRLERPHEAGVAHFMEHLTFKGTSRFPTSRAISEAIEGVGGSFNAATDRESTVYWVRVPARVAADGVNVIGELIVRPTLEEREIEGERDVIVEEIRGYLDDPAEYDSILFQQAMFGDGPLGREICGDEDGIRSLASDTIREFWGSAYRPANTVVAVAGDVSHEDAVEPRRRRIRARQRRPADLRSGAGAARR